MTNFYPGQRWISETEPELGLGIVSDIQSKRVTLEFFEAKEVRTYGIAQAPLKRVTFATGESFKTIDGRTHEVEDFEVIDGVYYYKSSDDQIICETQLSSKIQFSKPQERFLNGFVDSSELYKLRRKTLQLKRKTLAHKDRGLMGGKISLIPHQLYIAQKAAEMERVRVLLADEVGLGKTIEASLILNRLILTSRVQRVLIILPDALVHQWFFELYRKFSLSFTLLNQETPLEGHVNPFLESDKVIVSLGLLKGSEKAKELLDQAEFELLIVDEAHGLKFTKGEPSFELSLVQNLSQKTEHLILLSATPEQFGERAHFERLKLIDPEKFSNYEYFLKQKEEYQKLAILIKKAKDFSDTKFKDWPSGLKDSFKKLLGETHLENQGFRELAEAIIDLYGTGQVYFRNLRKTMEQEFLFFPKRFLEEYPLENIKKSWIGWSDHKNHDDGLDKKLDWLVELIETKLKNEKILIICRSKEKIIQIEKKLSANLSSLKLASFHSDQGLLARDRQAAYFADPDGAQVLLCTELGSEGRNFEFCQNLVLLDLPLHPSALEQRIGRLDRIGQKRDIFIHVSYLQESWEEVLFRWYRDGLGVFEYSREAASATFDLFKKELQAFMEGKGPKDFLGWLESVRQKRALLERELEEGRDQLVEMNSYEPVTARNIHRRISQADADPELADYMEAVFESFGVDVKEVTGNIIHIRPGDNMFVPVFPYLPHEGLSLSFSRSEILRREELEFMTWDHPMPLGCMEMLLSQNFGSTCFVQRKEKKGKGQLYFETHFVLECPAPKELRLEQFGVGDTLRFLIDDKGKDLSEKWTEEFIDQKTEPASGENLAVIKKFPRTLMNQLVKLSEELAKRSFLERQNVITQEVQDYYGRKKKRLKQLQVFSQDSFDSKYEEIEVKEVMTQKALESSTFRLDSIRVIV